MGLTRRGQLLVGMTALLALLSMVSFMTLNAK